MLLVLILNLITTVADSQAQLDVKSIFESCTNEAISCIGMSEANCIKTHTCDYLVTFKRIQGLTKFHLVGGIQKASSAYIAIGFSNDPGMGSEVLVQCSIYQGSHLGVNFSYNSPGPGSSAQYDLFPQASQYLLQPQITHQDGRILCSFKVPLTFKVATILPAVSLSSQRYYLLVAVGHTRAPYKIDYHYRHRSFGSSKSLDFKTKTVEVLQVKKERARMGIAVHVVLANVVFICLMPTGVLVGRYYKECRIGIRYFGKRLWFHIHVSLVVLGFVCVLTSLIALSFIIGVFYLAEAVPKIQIHYALGLTVICLYAVTLSIGIFTAFFDNIRRSRRISSIAHPISGMLTWILGMIHIALVPYTVPSHLAYCTAPTLVAIAGVALFIFTGVILSCVMFQSDRKLHPVTVPAPPSKFKDDKAARPSDFDQDEQENPDEVATFVFSLEGETGTGSGTGSVNDQSSSGADVVKIILKDTTRNSNELQSLGSGFTWDSAERPKKKSVDQAAKPKKSTKAVRSSKSKSKPLAASKKTRGKKSRKVARQSKETKSRSGSKRTKSGSGSGGQTNPEIKTTAITKQEQAMAVPPAHGVTNRPILSFDKEVEPPRPVRIVPLSKTGTDLSQLKKLQAFDEYSVDGETNQFGPLTITGPRGLTKTAEDDFWQRVHGTKKWGRCRAFTQFPVGASRYQESPNTRIFEFILGLYFLTSLALAVVNSWLVYPSSFAGACFVGTDEGRTSKWFIRT